MKHIDKGINDSSVFSDGVPKEGLRVDDLLVRLAHIILIKEKLKFLEDNPGSALFPDDIKVCYPSLGGRLWKEEHDIVLLKAILKHGYARWQSIVEDKVLGLYEVSRQELNLPVIKGHCASSSFNEADAAKGTQSTPDSSNFHQFKEVQRRIVEFIRKRYQLLEKILDLEICLAEDDKLNPSDPVGENTVAEPRIDEIQLETVKPEIDTAAKSEGLPSNNNNVAHLDMPKLDNGLHKVCESNALNSASSSLGRQPELATINNDGTVKTQESRAHNPVVGENGFTLLNSESSIKKEEKN